MPEGPQGDAGDALRRTPLANERTYLKQVEDAIARGGYAGFDPRASLVFAGVGVLLGVGTILIVLVESS